MRTSWRETEPESLACRAKRERAFELLESRALLSSYLVDIPDDVVDGRYGRGLTALREAISLANANPGADSITFHPSLSGQTIILTLGELGITDDLDITGLGASNLAVSGNNTSRVFNIDSGVTASITGLTVTGGNAATSGGGILIDNSGTLTITDSTVSGNTATADGGGISSDGGTLTVTGSTVSGNTASDSGGGIFKYGGTFTLEDSTVSGNSARSGGGINNWATFTIKGSTVSGNIANWGGGIDHMFATLTLENSTVSGNIANGGGGISNMATLTLTNSTVSGNSANEHSGGIYNGVTLAIIRSTVSGNTATLEGGGINNYGTLTVKDSTVSGNSASSGGGILNSDALTLENSTVSGNSASSGGGLYNDAGSIAAVVSTIVAENPGGDIDGSALGAGSTNNLIGDSGSAGGLVDGVDGNIVGVDPELGPLAGNGGPTRTHALLPSSPAIDEGSNPGGLPTDQRGTGFPRERGGTVDIGAFEFDPDDHASADQWPNATRIPIDPNTGDGSRAGEVGNNRDTDLFKFTVASSGTATITLDVGAFFDGWFEVYDSAHNLVAPRANAKAAGGDEVGGCKVVANQVYFVLVGGWRDPGGAYTLEVDGPAAKDDHADADAWDSATNIPIDPNSGDGNRPGEIEAAGDADLFRLVAAADGALNLMLDVGKYFDGRFKVYDNAHVKLNPGDESLWVNARAFGGDEAWSLTAVANQVYFILVGGWRMPGGYYTIRVDGQSAPDDHADAGAWSSATMISLDGSGDGRRSGYVEAAGDTDLFSFAAPTSGPATITLDVGDRFDGWFEVYDSAHNLVAPRANAKATGGDEALTFTGVADQIYFVLVGGWRSPGGWYNVLVNA